MKTKKVEIKDFESYHGKWIVKFVKRVSKKEYGVCIFNRMQIKIENGLSEKKKQEIILHELLHAHFPYLDEETITVKSKSLLNCLRKLKMINENKIGTKKI